MSIKKRHNYNTDKLKICYRQPQELFDYLSNFENGDFVHYDCFCLQIIDNGKSNETDKPSTLIKANCICDDGTLFGTFEFHNSARYEGKCFFEFTNKVHYTLFSNYPKKSNILPMFEYVEQVLGLEKNNITKLEIACDVNFNPLPKILKMIKDSENYDLIINGKVVESDEQIIKDYGEYFERTRKKRKRYPTIYISQRKDDAPSLKIYDKGTEIKVKNKEYIKEWNEYNTSTQYRIEIEIKNEDIKQFLREIGKDVEHWGELGLFLTNLTDQAFKECIWLYTTNKMLRFRLKSNIRHIITLHDLTSGEVDVQP